MVIYTPFPVGKMPIMPVIPNMLNELDFRITLTTDTNWLYNQSQKLYPKIGKYFWSVVCNYSKYRDLCIKWLSNIPSIYCYLLLFSSTIFCTNRKKLPD